jgi:hypothetical protein
MKKKSKAEMSAIDRMIEQMYAKYASGRQINVLDIGKIFAAGYAASDADREEAVKAAVDKYCLPR